MGSLSLERHDHRCRFWRTMGKEVVWHRVLRQTTSVTNLPNIAEKPPGLSFLVSTTQSTEWKGNRLILHFMYGPGDGAYRLMNRSASQPYYIFRWQFPDSSTLLNATIPTFHHRVGGYLFRSSDLHPHSLNYTTGQLPFLVHEQHSISSFSSIVKYIVGLKKEHPQCDLDAPLAPSEWSQRNAWASHIESHFGNLVVSWKKHLLFVR